MHNYISKIILAIFAVSLVSCELLSTRDAEEPEIGRTLNLPATTVEQLFLNVRNALSEKITKDYTNSFVDSSFTNIPFLFTPSSTANFKYDVFTFWDLESEEKYFNSLINTVGEKGNIFLNLELLESSIDGNSQSLSYAYSLAIPFIDNSTPQVFEGISFFKVILDDNNHWVIAEWSDIENGNNPTWSELKGRFYIF